MSWDDHPIVPSKYDNISIYGWCKSFVLSGFWIFRLQPSEVPRGSTLPRKLIQSRLMFLIHCKQNNWTSWFAGTNQLWGPQHNKVEIDWKHIAYVDFLADQFSWPLWHTVGVFSRFFHVQGAFTMFQLKEINRGIPTYGYLWNFHTVKDTLIWGFVSSPLWSQPRQEQCFSENNSQRLTLMSGGNSFLKAWYMIANIRILPTMIQAGQHKFFPPTSKRKLNT